VPGLAAINATLAVALMSTNLELGRREHMKTEVGAPSLGLLPLEELEFGVSQVTTDETAISSGRSPAYASTWVCPQIG
jgi:hypothetical protein